MQSISSSDHGLSPIAIFTSVWPRSQGLDVVHAVSRAAVGVANTLDSAIEQLMEVTALV